MAKNQSQSEEAGEKLPSVRICGTMQVHHRLLRTVPGYRETRDISENHALRAAMWPQAGRTGCTKIPVVVHVVYKTAAQNISDAQIKSQIDVLNADYRKKNADISTAPAAFAPLANDARITFELAKTDPLGNPTNGITRTATTISSFSDDDAVKLAASGGANPWPSDKFLNIWVCQLAGGLLGYAQFPGGPAATDGVVILHSAFGTKGTAAAPFNLGRTATHEIGHWLNLRHIWGDDGNGCAGSDFVADTPNQAGPNYGAPIFPHVSCSNGPNGDMFMNYMDYVDDKAMIMFTTGQVARMQATLDSLRSSIGVSVSCGKVLPKDLPKDNPKDFVKEPPKDLPKDNPKEFVKEPPKDLPKDNPKEFVKEPPKDLPKDNPKDFVKEPVSDPILKNPFSDLVKLAATETVQFPGNYLTNPANWMYGMGATPNMPYVLATGATGTTGQGPQVSLRQENAALAASYLQLLAQFTRLHMAGKLDTEGLAAWQEAMTAYQRLTITGI